MGYQLGIDVGTTYTAAAVCRSSDRPGAQPEVVTLGARGATIPSVLFLADDDTVVVGEAAQRRALTDPDRVVREFKRRVGDPTPIVVGARSYAPEELSARLVRWVVDQVAQREGGLPDAIALTHPASWGLHKQRLLTAALAAQGVPVTLLAEPQAAALHYATQERVPVGSTIAVYDLGGGTFDAAVVHKAEPGSTGPGAAPAPASASASDDAEDGRCFGLLGRPEGLDRLGGMDFDEAVFEHVRAAFPDVFAALDDADPDVLSAVARVRRECTEAKEALSADTDASIPVLLPGGAGSVRLHRSEFETLIRPYLAETVEALRAAVASAGCLPAALTAVLLVGGSSRIPLVAQLVSEGLGRPVAVDADPKNAIAKGAALAVAPRPAPTASLDTAEPETTAFGVVAPVTGGSDDPDALAESSSGPPPPPDRATSYLHPSEPEPGDEPAPRRRRRPVGLLAGISGVLAVIVVVLAVVVLPRLAATSSPRILTDSGAAGGSTAPPLDQASPAPGAPPRAETGARSFGALDGSAGADGTGARTGGTQHRPAGGVAAAGGARAPANASPQPKSPQPNSPQPNPATSAAPAPATTRAQSPPKTGGGKTTAPRSNGGGSGGGPKTSTSASNGGHTGGGTGPSGDAPTGGATTPAPSGDTPPVGSTSGGGADTPAPAPAASAPAPVVAAPAPAADPVAAVAVSANTPVADTPVATT